MWHGVPEYVAVVAVAAATLHLLIRRYVVASVAGAVLSSVGNMVHEAWLADFRVNPGWALPLFIVGLLLSLPVCLVIGLPFLGWRHSRRPILNCGLPKN